MEKESCKSIDKAAVKEALNTLEKSRSGIVLTGRVQDGKVILDEDSLKEIAEKFPRADISFVAVNAPFDPLSLDVANGGVRTGIIP